MRKFLALLLTLAVTASLLTSFAAAEGADYKDTLTVAVTADTTTFDPQEGGSMLANTIVFNNVYDKLVNYDYKTTTYTPGLATSWEVPDETTVILHLREGVTFSNGNPFTADDVLFTFNRALETSRSASTYFFYDKENSYAEDDYTVVLKLTQPYAQVFDVLSSARGDIVDKEYTEEVGAAGLGQQPIGTGPYILTDWLSGTEIHFKRNENYWGEKAASENLVIKVIPEASNRVIELETGDVDAAYEISGSDAARVDATDGIHILSGPAYRYYTLTFNMQNEKTGNQDLRYAVSAAIDKELLTEAIFAGTAEPANGFIPSNVFSFLETGVLPYDPELAKEYLAKAGYPDGLTLKFQYDSTEIARNIAEVVQGQLAEVGIDLEMYEMSSTNYTGQGNEFELALRAGNAGEPSNILIIYDSAFGDRINSNDDWLDAQLAEAKTIFDDAARAAKYQEIQQYLYEKRYTIPLSFTSVIYGLSDKVEGWDCHPNQALDLSKVAVLK